MPARGATAAPYFGAAGLRGPRRVGGPAGRRPPRALATERSECGQGEWGERRPREFSPYFYLQIFYLAAVFFKYFLVFF